MQPAVPLVMSSPPLPCCLASTASLRSSTSAVTQVTTVPTHHPHPMYVYTRLPAAASTVAATVMTPTLTSLLAGAYIPVDGWVSCCRFVSWQVPCARKEGRCLLASLRWPCHNGAVCALHEVPTARHTCQLRLCIHPTNPPCCLLQALFKSTVQLVLLPTVLGLLANEYFKKQVGAGQELLA